MNQKYLLEIKVREQAATPGPWMIEMNRSIKASDGRPICAPCSHFEDALFIAHARTDIPALIAEVERLTARADQSALNYQQKCRDVEELENSVERFADQHQCDVHNIAAMQTTLDQQAKNCEKLIENYKEPNLEQATENYELEQENSTLKKALELASINISSRLCPPIVCNGRISEGKCTKCWIEYYIHQAEQTHETQEVEK